MLPAPRPFRNFLKPIFDFSNLIIFYRRTSGSGSKIHRLRPLKIRNTNPLRDCRGWSRSIFFHKSTSNSDDQLQFNIFLTQTAFWGIDQGISKKFCTGRFCVKFISPLFLVYIFSHSKSVKRRVSTLDYYCNSKLIRSQQYLIDRRFFQRYLLFAAF